MISPDQWPPLADPTVCDTTAAFEARDAKIAMSTYAAIGSR
jgi:hypothetical protein